MAALVARSRRLLLFPRISPVVVAAPSRSITSRLLKTRHKNPDALFNRPAGDDKPFYITTPIFYVNASPHIGHLHSIVLTDVLARFARLRNPDREVVFATGTDEHGLKIQQAAAKAGITEQAFCDEVSQRFRNLADAANISYTDFIRTSEPRHYRAVEHFWESLVQSGAVYKGRHEGWYSVSDECFYAEKQIEKRRDGKAYAIETGNEVTYQVEENWKFRLSKFGDSLYEWYQATDKSVQPDRYKEELLKQAQNVTDLSISRPSSRVKWGVPVPGDPDQTIYVWVDALVNYLTVAGYPGPHPAWPADMHVVGKDIIRFHAQHWPALLMAAGEEPPRRVLAHGHWTMGNAKMSKSRGNVADPHEIMDRYGVDIVRWYLMHMGGSLKEDADYSERELFSHYTRLKNMMGNLLARLSSPAILAKVGSWDQELMSHSVHREHDHVKDRVDNWMEAADISMVARQITRMLWHADSVFTRLAPWAADDSTAAVVQAYHSMRMAGILLLPIMPAKATEMLDRLGVPENERRWVDIEWDESIDDAAQIVARLRQAKNKFGKTVLLPHVDVDFVPKGELAEERQGRLDQQALAKAKQEEAAEELKEAKAWAKVKREEKEAASSRC